MATVLIYLFLFFVLLPSWSAVFYMDTFLTTSIKFPPFIYACVCAIDEQVYVSMFACV